MQTAIPLDLWDRFASKAEALGAVVRRAASEAVALELIRPAAAPAPTCTRSLAERFPRVADGCAPLANGEKVADQVVARGVLAVAETGSVLVDEPNRDRAACFLADHLWLLVSADQIVPTLDDAFERLGERIRAGAPYLTFMTGPSRSADIERTLTVGVHGPRELTIVVVGQEAT